MDDWTKLVGITLSALAIGSAAVKWLISSYFAKAQELEDIKELWTKQALSDLKDASSGLRTDLCELREQMEEIKSELSTLSHALKDINASHLELRKRTSPLKNTKLVRFSNDLYLIQKKE
jgi:predicted nuclease with TOPRIM domain